MEPGPGFTDRLWAAYFEKCRRERRRISQAEMAKAVEGWIRKDHPRDRVADSTVSRWFSGATPEPRYVEGLSHFLSEGGPRIDPGWLLFGDESEAPAPPWELTETPPPPAPLVALPPAKARKRRGRA